MSWLEIWAMLKVIGIVVALFMFVCFFVLIIVLGIRDWLDSRKKTITKEKNNENNFNEH